MKSARRKSPVLPRRQDRGDKTTTLLTTTQATSSTLTANSNSLTLPATPSSHSICLSTSDINHPNVTPSTPSTPVPSTVAAAAAAAAAASMDISLAAVKTNEDQSILDDDPDLSYFSSGGGEMASNTVDDMDGTGNNISMPPGTPEYQKVRLAMEQIHAKVNKTRELIRDEQTARDENVNEYLRLASQADKLQQTRLKAVFEKKNTKSAQQMAHLQRKLDSYQRRLRVLEAQGATGIPGHRAPKQVLRGVGIGIKTVISKPREFAHLIRNKFGSADNISHLARSGDHPSHSTGAGTGDEVYSASSALTAGNSNSLPGHNSQAVTSAVSVVPAASQGSGGGKYTSEEGSECGSSVTSESIPGGLHMSPRHNAVGTSLGLSLDPFFQELQERREEVDRLREEMDHVKQHLQQEVSFVSAALQEERFRVERLEEQINDLTELHQNEVENLKQNIIDMEEKVQYQSEERLRDIHDLLDSCHTRISKVEHQAQHQQHVSLEGIENSNARAVLVKLINMALTLLQLVLVVVSTAANIISPFLKTRLRVLTSCVLALLFAFVLKQWPHLVDLGGHLIQHCKAALTS